MREGTLPGLPDTARLLRNGMCAPGARLDVAPAHPPCTHLCLPHHRRRLTHTLRSTGCRERRRRSGVPAPRRARRQRSFERLARGPACVWDVHRTMCDMPLTGQSRAAGGRAAEWAAEHRGAEYGGAEYGACGAFSHYHTQCRVSGLPATLPSQRRSPALSSSVHSSAQGLKGVLARTQHAGPPSLLTPSR